MSQGHSELYVIFPEPSGIFLNPLCQLQHHHALHSQAYTELDALGILLLNPG